MCVYALSNTSSNICLTVTAIADPDRASGVGGYEGSGGSESGGLGDRSPPAGSGAEPRWESGGPEAGDKTGRKKPIIMQNFDHICVRQGNRLYDQL